MSDILQDISFEENARNTYVDFLIRADGLDPIEVTRALGIEPTHAWAKHESYQGKTRNPKTKEIQLVWRKRPTGIWAIDSTALSSKEKVETHILYLLDKLEPQKRQLDNFLTQKDIYTVRFYIWWEPYDAHGSYEITSGTLNRMTMLSHHVEFAFIG